jgi:hypothetical protein
MSDEVVAVGLGFAVLVALTYLLHRPWVQASSRYQATVVPLANIMDVGFIVLAPVMVFLAGYAAPVVMLAICLVAIATGYAIAYNIRHFEPLVGTDDSLESVERVGEWSLLAASIVNIAYYTLLLVTLILWPLHAYSAGQLKLWGSVVLLGLATIGWFGGMDWLNRQGYRSTGFNLAAVMGVVTAFVVYNVHDWLGGRWHLPKTDMSLSTTDIRKLIGLFALVQGFEASRYIGARFGREERVSTMRLAQYISSVVFVALLASVLILFVEIDVPKDGTGIFVVANRVGDLLPWLVLFAAIGSQTSAIINAAVSRSDLLVEAKVPRRVSFAAILVPATVLFLLVDVTAAVALASRVFATYFAIQALIAGTLARRARNWWALAGFIGIGLMMVTVAVFGLPV